MNIAEMKIVTSPVFSIVSPIYRAENIAERLVEAIEDAISKITSDYEIILVEDGSPDNSWAVIESIALKNPKVKAIKLCRNFGQHYAITAGLDVSKGEWMVVMDCDLQDNPQEINKMYLQAIQGYDVVLASRIDRKDNLLKKSFSILFYKILSYLSGTKFDHTVANFGIYNRKVIDAFCSMKETIRVFPVMINWLGFRTIKVNVEHSKRIEGKSTYNFKRLFNLAIDIILAFSDKPLRLIIRLGLLFSISAFIFAGIIFVMYLLGDISVLGYTSLIISIWFLSGVIMLTLGVIGLYIGKIFEGVKKRPLYIIEKQQNC